VIKSTGNFHSWYVCETSLFNVLRCCYSIDHSTPASQSPHSSNPSSLPSSPPTHNHNSVPFSNFGPIGTPDNRDRRTADRWKTDKPGEIQSSLLSRSELTYSVSFLDLWQWKNIFLNYSFLFIPSHGFQEKGKIKAPRGTLPDVLVCLTVHVQDTFLTLKIKM